MSSRRETIFPELFQHLYLLRFFRFCAFPLRQNFFGVSVDFPQLPPGVLPDFRFLFAVYLLCPVFVLEGEHSQPQILRLPDYHVLDGTELLLPGEGPVFPGCVLVVPLHLVPKPVPLLIAGRHLRQVCQLIHDGVHLCLHRFLQILIDLFPFGVPQHLGQPVHLLRNHRTVAEAHFHLSDETAHGLHGCIPHLLIGEILFPIEGEQLVLKDGL